MALTQTEVSQLYVAIFNRASEGEGNTFWQTFYVESEAEETMGDVANAMLATTDAKEYFGDSIDSNQDFIEHIYLNTLNKTIADDPDGIAYWVGRLDAGESRGDVVTDLVFAATTEDNAGDAQDQFNNRVDVSNYAADTCDKVPANYKQTLGFKTSAFDGDLVVTHDPDTIAPAEALVDRCNDIIGDNLFTLMEVPDVDEVTVPGTELYWDEVRADDFLDFLVKVAGIDVAQLGLIDVNGDSTIDSVVNITIGEVDADGEVDIDNDDDNDVSVGSGTGSITFRLNDGSLVTTEADLGIAYLEALGAIMFKEDGGTHLNYGEDEVIQEAVINAAIKLTPSLNNGGTVETGYTNDGNDVIVAGRTELLHAAYIDGGGGYNILEVDMKGVYAQPLQLLNIQEVSVQNLPNIYTTHSYYYNDGFKQYGVNPNYTGYYDHGYGSTYPLVSGDGPNQSILDLSRATDIERLVVTEGVFGAFDGQDATLGSLTIVGIRNNATVSVEGGFTEDVYLHYGRGLGDGINLELNLGDTSDFNLFVAHNSDTLNILSTGGGNWIQDGFLGGELSNLNITGNAELFIEGDLDTSFHDGHPVTIDASLNTAGVNLNLSGSENVTFVGSSANDRFLVSTNSDAGSPLNDEMVTIEGGEGNNIYNVDTHTLHITNGDGNNNYEVIAVVSDITAGDGNNHFEVDVQNGLGNVDSSATLLVGNGNNRFDIAGTNDSVTTVIAGNGDNIVNTNSGQVVNVTTGNGDDSVSAINAEIITANVGGGNNVIVASGEELNLIAGAGDDAFTVAGTIGGMEGSATGGVNLMLILDNSGSLSAQQLANTKAATIALLDEYAAAGVDVAVNVVTFSPSDPASAWTDIAAAKAEINAMDGSGGTYFEDAMADSMTAWDLAGKMSGASNQVVFTSDGQSSVSSAVQATWETFLTSESIIANAFGIGAGSTIASLEPIAYDGVNGVDIAPVVVLDSSDLTDAIKDGIEIVPATLGNGATIDIDMGQGSNTLTLGDEDQLVQGIVADADSVITGENIELVVVQNSNLAFASLTGITSVVLGVSEVNEIEGVAELMITAEQFIAIGLENFSVDGSEFGGDSLLKIIITSDMNLSDLGDLSQLAAGIDFSLSIANDATLTLTAEELHTYISDDGIDATFGLEFPGYQDNGDAMPNGGSVVITEAGLNFDPFTNGQGGGSLLGEGEVEDGAATGLISDDVTVIRTVDGWERPKADDSTDTLLIDSDVDNLIDEDLVSIHADTLEIIGDQDIEFTGTVGFAGGDQSDDPSAAFDGFTVDFSGLNGTVTGLTIADFNYISGADLDETFDDGKIIGNNEPGTRIDVEVNGQVGGEGIYNGLHSSGVSTYVVTAIGDGDVTYGIHEQDFYVCDLTEDLEVLGLQGSYDDTINFMQVQWGVEFLMEGDGEEEFSLKANGTPKYSNIGTLNADFFWEGAPAVVNIDNQGVATDRAIHVAGINIDNATSLVINGSDADIIIASLGSDRVETLTFNSANNITLQGNIDEIEFLNAIDASGVDIFTLELTGSNDLSELALTDVDSIILVDGAIVTLTNAQLEFTNISGEGTVEVVELADQPYNEANISDIGEGITVNVTMADGEYALDASTDLSNVTVFTVPEDAMVTMTADQAMQLVDLDGNRTIVGTGAVHVIGADQSHMDGADLDDLDDGLGSVLADFNDAGISGSLTITGDIELTASILNDAALENFTLIGQNDPRVDVIMDEANGLDPEFNDGGVNNQVGLDTVNGVKSTGIPIYVVVDLDDSKDDVFYVCNDTHDLVTLGLQANGGDAIVFGGVKRGVDFLMEGDGYASWLDVEKVDDTPDESNIGALTATFFTANNPTAVVNINNQGTELADSSDPSIHGGERILEVDGVTINNTLAVTINVTDGDAIITAVGGDQATSLTLTATEDLTIVEPLSIILTDIDATAVTDAFVATLVDMDEAFTLTTGANATITLDGVSADAGTVIDGSAGILTLVIAADTDLSAATLSGVDAIEIAEDVEVTLTAAQVDTIGEANISGVVAEVSNDAEVLNINELTSADEIIAAELGTDVVLGTVTMADGDQALHVNADLTGATSIEIPEGGSLTMTVDQFMALDDSEINVIGNPDIEVDTTLTLTGLTQAHIDAGFSLDEIDEGITGSVSLAEDVWLQGRDEANADTYEVDTIWDNDLAVVMSDAQILRLANSTQADGMDISGGVDTTVMFQFITLDGVDTQIDASGYEIDTLKAIDVFFDANNDTENAEFVIENLPASVTLNVFNSTEFGYVDGVDRVVIVESGSTLPGQFVFNDIQPEQEVTSLDLTLIGNEIVNVPPEPAQDGSANITDELRIPGVDSGELIPTHFGVLNITSTGTGDVVNNIGNITAFAEVPADPATAVEIENNLLVVNIAADQDLEIDGIVFSSIAAIDDEATATLDVDVAADTSVTIGDLGTADDDVDALTVTHTGDGAFTFGLSSLATIDATDVLTLVGSVTGTTTITISGMVDLSDDTLSDIDAVVINDTGTLTLSHAQLVGIGLENITNDPIDGADATLNINELAEEPFDAITGLQEDIDIHTVTIAANPAVKLHADTDLTDVDVLVVPEGTTLDLTAAQFQQLAGNGTIIGDGTVNITDLTQADVDAGFNVSDIDAVQGLITLASDAALTVDVTLASDSVIANFAIELATDQEIQLSNFEQAHELVVTNAVGAVNTEVVLYFTDSALDASINAAGYAIDKLSVFDQLIDGATGNPNVESLLEELDSSVPVFVFDVDAIYVPADISMINRTIHIEEGVSVDSDTLFTDLLDNQRELETLTITMEGGSIIDGDVRLDKVANEELGYFDQLIINSIGSENNIDGLVRGFGTANNDNNTDPANYGDGRENNVLNVAINAEEDLNVGGVVFSARAVEKEMFTYDINVNESAADGETFTFDGTTITFGAAVNQTAIAEQIAAGLYAHWDVISDGNTVTFTQRVAGDFADVVDGDFGGTAGILYTLVTINQGSENDETANLVVDVDAGKTVNIGDLGTSDSDVDSLIVTHTGDGALTVGLSSINTIDPTDAITITGSVNADAIMTVIIDGEIDLSDDTLTDVDAILLTTGSTLTVSTAQLLDVTEAGFATVIDGEAASLIVNDYNGEFVDFPAIDSDLTVTKLIVRDTDATVEVDAGVDLSNVLEIEVPEGTTLELTAAQFNQLIGDGTITGAGTVNITELTQTDVDNGFDLSDVSAVNGTITLAEDVIMSVESDLNGFAIELADAQRITLSNQAQADDRVITGTGASSEVVLGFDTLGNGASAGTGDTELGTDNYAVSDVYVFDKLVELYNAQNVEELLQGLDSSVIVRIFDLTDTDITVAEGAFTTQRTVFVEPDTVVATDVVFNDLETNREISELMLTLSGNSVIEGDLNVATIEDGIGFNYLQTLDIYSVGSSANAINGVVRGGEVGAADENNVLEVMIDATIDAPLSIDGIIFSSRNVTETFVLDFADDLQVVGSDAIAFDGTTVVLTDGFNDLATAAAVAGAVYANWGAVDNYDGTVTFTSNTPGVNVADISDGDFKFIDNGDSSYSSTLAGEVTIIKQGGGADASATLNVTGAGDVTIADLGTSDDDVVALEVVHTGTGALTIGLSTVNTIDETDALTITGDAVGLDTLLIDTYGPITDGGPDTQVEMDLSNDNLSNIDAIILQDEAVLTLSQAQIDALPLGLGSIEMAEAGFTATLNVADLGEDVFDATLVNAGISIGVVSIIDTDAVVTLHTDTDLTGVASIDVPEGTTLNLTAAQFQQLDGSGTITGDGTVNITDLTQADVDHADGFDLSDVSAIQGEITLAEDVTLKVATDLGTDFSITLADNQSIGLSAQPQADDREINGGADTSVVLGFDFLGGGVLTTPPPVGNGDTELGASAYAVTNLYVFDKLIELYNGNNVETLLPGLASSVQVIVFEIDDIGLPVDPDIDAMTTHRSVTVEADTTVATQMVFNNLNTDHEIAEFELLLSGGSIVNGNIDLSTSNEVSGELFNYLQTLSVDSQGDSANEINGLILGNGSVTGRENNVLNVNINADAALTIDGVVFSSRNETEEFVLDLDDALLVFGSDTLEFKGTTVPLADGDTAADVAAKLVAAMAGDPDWGVAVDPGDATRVVFTSTIDGFDVADVATGDFVFTDVGFTSENLAGNVTITNQGGGDEATATLNVSGTADVNIGDLDTDDVDGDVDYLVVNHTGTGALTIGLSTLNTINESDILTINGVDGVMDTLMVTSDYLTPMDLSNDTLVFIDAIVMTEDSVLTLTQAQIDDIGLTNITMASGNGTLNINEFGEDPFDARDAQPGVNIGVITIDDTNPEVTLDPATNLEGVDEIVVPEGVTLFLTAEQFNQLDGNGTITGDGTVNIANLSQADVDAGLNLSDVQTSTAGYLHLDENLTLLTTTDLGAADGFAIFLDDNLTIGLSTQAQADDREIYSINSSVTTTVQLGFDMLGDAAAGFAGDYELGTGAYDITNLFVFDKLIELYNGNNVETLLQDLDSTIVVTVFERADDTELPVDLDPNALTTSRIVVVEADTTIESDVVFNDLDTDHEVSDLTLTLSGGSVIDGDLNLATTDEATGISFNYLQSLEITSNGATENAITGTIKGGPDGDITENNILDVTINANATLSIGAVVFTSRNETEAFTLDIDPALAVVNDTTTSLTFDGETLNFSDGDGSAEVALALIAASPFPNWTAVAGSDASQVLFTSNTPGVNVPDILDGHFTFTDTGFSSTNLDGDVQVTNQGGGADETAYLTVVGDNDVTIGDLGTDDDDVTGLVVTHTGTGGLTIGLSTVNTIDNADLLTITGSAAGLDTLLIDTYDESGPTQVPMDLSDDNLSDIDAIVFDDEAELTLSFTQIDMIGLANITVAVPGDNALIHVRDLGEDPFDASAVNAGVSIGAVSIVGNPVVTLDPTTNLSGVISVDVPEGTILNLTAEQFQQLDGAGTITGDGTVNITGLTKADIDLVDGLDLSDVTATQGALTLAEDVTLALNTELADFSITLVDTQNIGLTTQAQADDREINATGTTSVTLGFDTLGDVAAGFAGDTELGTGAYNGITNLYVFDGLVEIYNMQNVEVLLQDLKSSIHVIIFDYDESDTTIPVTLVDDALTTIRTVTIQADTVVDTDMVFNDLDDDHEVAVLTLNFMGGSVIGTDLTEGLDLSTGASAADVSFNYLQSLTINSTGANPNAITGDITGGADNTASENNLLTVTINADTAFSVHDIVFTSREETETFELTLDPALLVSGPDTIEFDGETVVLADGDTELEVAAKIVAHNAGSFSADWTTLNLGGGKVRFTSTQPGVDVPNVSTGDFTFTDLGILGPDSTSFTGDVSVTNQGGGDGATATLNVNGTGDVTINDLNTGDDEVDNLVVNHTGTGTLVVGLSTLATIDETDLITINGDAVGTDTLVVESSAGVPMDLSNDVLVNVDSVVMKDGSVLTLSQTQIAAIGLADITVPDFAGGDAAVLHIVNLGVDEFDASAVADGVSIATITILDTDAELTLHADTDLTGVGEIIVPEGTTLNLTAEQFQQLDGTGTVSGPGTVNITTLRQEDVDYVGVGGDTSGLDLSLVSAIRGYIHLDADVTLRVGTNIGDAVPVFDINGDVESVTGFSIKLDDNLQVTFSNYDQSDYRVVTGEALPATSTVQLGFDTLGGGIPGPSIHVEGYNVTDVRVLDRLIESSFPLHNLGTLLLNLPVTADVTIFEYIPTEEESTLVDGVDPAAIQTSRTVTIDPNVVVDSNLAYVELDQGFEVMDLTLNLSGGSVIDGDLRLTSQSEDVDSFQYFNKLTINSNSVAPGVGANEIDGMIRGVSNFGFVFEENNLLDIEINAEQDLIIGTGASDLITFGPFTILDGGIYLSSRNESAMVELNLADSMSIVGSLDTVEFDTTTVALADGDDATAVALAIVAQINADGANAWTAAVDGSDPTNVIFTSKTPGVLVAPITAADFTFTDVTDLGEVANTDFTAVITPTNLGGGADSTALITVNGSQDVSLGTVYVGDPDITLLNIVNNNATGTLTMVIDDNTRESSVTDVDLDVVAGSTTIIDATEMVNGTTFTIDGDGDLVDITADLGEQVFDFSAYAGTSNSEGGAGIDSQTGGAGVNNFIFSLGDTGQTVATADIIDQFTTGQDTIDVNTTFPYSEADGAANNEAAFLVNALAAFVTDNTYVEYNANGTGNAWVLNDMNGNTAIDAGDVFIELIGISLASEIDAGDFV